LASGPALLEESTYASLRSLVDARHKAVPEGRQADSEHGRWASGLHRGGGFSGRATPKDQNGKDQARPGEVAQQRS